MPNQDLLSVFLTVPDEDGELMTDEVIKDNLLFVVAAGYETSSNTMAVALKYLAENPSILTQVLQGEDVHRKLFRSTFSTLARLGKSDIHYGLGKGKAGHSSYEE